MKIWLINNYNMLPEHGQLNRNYFLGKYLKRLGHEPVAFVGSHPHNTNLQLIEGKERFRVYREEPFPWVLIKTRNYEGSRKQRVISMFEFYFNMLKAAKHFDPPDAIVGSSAHPLAAYLAIKLGKKYGCRKVVEVRDLWPESIVAYGIAKKSNPIIKLMYRFEKYLYTHADAIVFTMEGAYDYIIRQGWDKDVPRSKVRFINNGVDLEEFDRNRDTFVTEDAWLADEELFKVIYVGSIRRVNDLGSLIDTAKLVQNPKIRFLVWGSGDQLEALEERVKNENVGNFAFHGRVEKKYIPYIISHADANILHSGKTTIGSFGSSANKLFEYFAAGKPVITYRGGKYNPAARYPMGMELRIITPEKVAAEIDRLSLMDKAALEEMGAAARAAAHDYDFKTLAKRMADLLEGKPEEDTQDGVHV